MRALPNIGVDEVTQSLLLRLNKNSNYSVDNNNNTTEQFIENYSTNMDISSMLNTSSLFTNNNLYSTTKLFPVDVNLSSPIKYIQSRYLIANLIETCTDIKTANILLQYAKQYNYDDNVIYLTVSKCYARYHDYIGALAQIDEMLQRGHRMSRYILSFLLRITTTTMQDSVIHAQYGVEKSIEYIKYCVYHEPQLLTVAVWNKLIKEFSLRGRGGLIMDLLEEVLDIRPGVGVRALDKNCIMRLLTTLTPSSQQQQQKQSQQGQVQGCEHDAVVKQQQQQPTVLPPILQSQAPIQSSTTEQCSPNPSPPPSTPALWRLLRRICTALYHTGTGDRPLSSYLDASHFNHILQVLSTTQHHHLVPEVLACMTQHYTKKGANCSDTSDETIISHTIIKPSTYTIAQMIRSGKINRDVGFIVKVLRWGVGERAYIPLGIISDSLSYLYR